MVAPLPFLALGGRMQPLQATTVYTPPTMNIQQTPNTITSPYKGGGGGGSSALGITGGISSIAGGVLDTLAQSNMGALSHPELLSGHSATQQTIDSVANAIPFYSLGKSIGRYAETDYKAQNEFGELANTDKFKVADTIGSFIDPLSSFISGVSGEGWTSKQRADIINKKGAGIRTVQEAQDAVNYKNREINAGYDWRYREQPMQAANGGYLGYSDDVLGQSFAMGGELLEFGKGGKIHIKPENRGKFTAYKQRTGKTTEEALHSKNPHVRQMANFARNARHWKHEFGGELEGQQQFMNPNPQITEYNEGGTHDMNTSGFGGVPVDASGNRTVVSANRPVATVEEGEVSWFDPNSKTAYVFSNKIMI